MFFKISVIFLIFTSALLIEAKPLADQQNQTAVAQNSSSSNGTANPNPFAPPEFFKQLSEPQLKELLSIIFNFSSTRTQVYETLNTWLQSQPEAIQTACRTWLSNMEQAKKAMVQNISSRLSPDAKKLFEDIQNVVSNKDLSYKEICTQIQSTLKNAPESVRNEFNIPGVEKQDSVDSSEGCVEGMRSQFGKFGWSEIASKYANDVARDSTSSNGTGTVNPNPFAPPEFFKQLSEPKLKELLSIISNFSSTRTQVYETLNTWLQGQPEAIQKASRAWLSNMEQTNKAMVQNISSKLSPYAKMLLDDIQNVVNNKNQTYEEICTQIQSTLKYVPEFVRNEFNIPGVEKQDTGSSNNSIEDCVAGMRSQFGKFGWSEIASKYANKSK